MCDLGVITFQLLRFHYQKNVTVGRCELVSCFFLNPNRKQYKKKINIIFYILLYFIFYYFLYIGAVSFVAKDKEKRCRAISKSRTQGIYVVEILLKLVPFFFLKYYFKLNSLMLYFLLCRI